MSPPDAARLAQGELGGHALHLARRLRATWSARRPGPTEDAWARTWLSAAEWELWQRHRGHDRRHTLAVARLVSTCAPPDTQPPEWVLAAALLHDIGKTAADLAVPGRVVAALLTLVGASTAPGRLGRYLRYPSLGGALLEAAGSDPQVVAWAAQHHWSPAQWTLPAQWAQALAAADHFAV